MKKYHVYGVGNALVDFEFDVSDDTLARLKIDKSVMTLIDLQREQELLEELDGIKHVKACGGSAANTVQAVRSFGGDVYYSCLVSNDISGQFYFEDLQRLGIDTNLSRDTLTDGRTGKCIAMITPDADRTMNTYLGVSEHLPASILNREAIKNSQYLYVEGYLVASKDSVEVCKQAIQCARETDTKIALTLSDFNMAKFFKNELLELIGDGVDLLFCNRREVEVFCDTTDLNKSLEQLKQFAKTFVVTLGKHGSLVFDGEKVSEVAPYDVDVLDTLGAGDMYAGAFLHSITHGFSYTEAARRANIASGICVSKPGPRLTESEFEFVHEIFLLDKKAIA